MMSQPDGHRTAPTFSIVVPVYNEAESLPELLASIAQAIAPLGETYEVVFVDDGSTDGSFDKLRSLSETHEHVRVFSFRRNLGKSPALLCGIHKATGQCILTMDADLQDDPSNLPLMYERLISEPADIVSGWRKERRDNLLKIVSSWIFNRLMIRLLFGLNVFNVGTGVAWSVKDIVQQLGRILGRPIRVVEEPSRVRATERMVLVADIEKIRRATAWTPRILLQNSLKDLVTAYALEVAPSSSD